MARETTGANLAEHLRVLTGTATVRQAFQGCPDHTHFTDF